MNMPNHRQAANAAKAVHEVLFICQASPPEPPNLFKLFTTYANSLKVRITLLALLIALFVFFSMMLFTGQRLRPLLKTLLAAQQLTTVSLVASGINDALAFRLKWLDSQAKRLTTLTALTTLTTLTNRRIDHALPDPLLDDAELFNGGLIVINRQGDILAETPFAAGHLGINIKDRAYFKAVLAEGKSVISPPLTGKKSQRPVVVVTVPIHDTQGRVIGALAGMIDLSQPNFIDRLTNNRFGRTGETFLVTPQTRTIISTSDKTRTMEVLPAPGVSPWIDSFMAGYEGSTVTVNPHGLEVLVSVKQVPISGWYASVILSAEETYAPISAVRHTIIFILTPLAGLVIAWLIWWMLRRQLAPLMEATRTLTTLATSDQPLAPLPITRHDEIGALIGGFNHLLDTLAQRQQALQESKEKLQLMASVFTHSNEVIIITAVDGSIIDTNEAFTRITGYSRDEVRGKNPRILNSGRQSAEFYSTMWKQLSTDGQWQGEIWNRRKNGEAYAAMLTISAVSNEAGEVVHYVALASDITQIKAHEQQLEQIANFDPLTKLPNRRLLGDRMHQALSQAQRRGQSLAVVFLDLDGFKVVNDQYGHNAGDHLLVELARRMKQTLREGDTLARLGGDEFVAVLLDVADIRVCEPMLNRLLAAAAKPVPFGDALLQVSASMGVTFYPQLMDVETDQLLRQADQAMYLAKQAGKNSYHVFTPEIA
jgi:diguanylate cyclase (GGDEF)-like protein/PAS domain S-box-containing protein